MHPPLSLPEVEHIVWTRLASCPGRRPRIADIACEACQTPLQVRRARRAHTVSAPCDDLGTLRHMVSHTCLTYAACLIARGAKVEAAMRVAGFSNKTNFARQTRRTFGCQPRDLRRGPIACSACGTGDSASYDPPACLGARYPWPDSTVSTVSTLTLICRQSRS